TIFLFAFPWIAVLVFLLLFTRIPSELPAADALDLERALRVSVVIPARNEAVNIENCVASIAASTYPDFEIIVVDDRSGDETASLARSVPPGNASRIAVIDGQELPEGWLGKPWACWQGAQAADGGFLLFTDADTTHGPQMLSRAVAGLYEDEADLMTVLGRQLMGSFWERLVQPQIFLLMLFRFPDFERAVKNPRWRDAIANGQYILFTRDAYHEIGGHVSVQGEVVEDMALAMLVKREGKRLRIRSAVDDLQTRMYRSLAGLIEGWSKNIVVGVWLSVPPFLRRVVAPIVLATGVSLWIAPPAVLLAGLAGWVARPLLLWSVVVYGVSVAIWGRFTHVMRGPPQYGFLYPLGALVGAYIFLRSWKRGQNVEWKGRRYTVRAPLGVPQ
ncbi:MAG: glycosyltransferase, partial [Gemmatimonadetes bacterium]|nr:glycosyltransferase [Gemmatimonadota bacterium]